MKNIIAFIIFISLTLSVYDCGYKGPLYLPKKPVASNPAASSPVASKHTSSSTWTITSKSESMSMATESSVAKN